MKSSPPEPQTSEAAISIPPVTGFRPFARLRNFLRQFKQDLRAPLAGAEGKRLPARLRMRLGFLYRKYGWKLVAGVVAYFLVRDTVLYIILPYLIAKRLID